MRHGHLFRMPSDYRWPSAVSQLSDSGDGWDGDRDDMMQTSLSAINRCDVVVVGAGPAGMAAAVTATDCGASVLLLDDNPQAGGQIWRGGESESKDRLSRRWFGRLESSRVHVLRRSQVLSASADSRILLIETCDSSFDLRFKKLVIAAGARELFLPFSGWTLPGVMGVGGLQAMVKSGLPIEGKRIVIGGSGPLLLAVAANLKKAGAQVRLIVEQADFGSVMRFGFGLLSHPSKIWQALDLESTILRTPVRYGGWVSAAEGEGCLERVQIQQGNKTWAEDCDYAAISYGLCPNLEIATLLGCRTGANKVVVDERQRSSVQDVYCAGEVTGVGGVELSLIEGEIAGYAAAGLPERAHGLFRKRDKALRFAKLLNQAYTLRKELKSLSSADTFVCRCEDVSYERLSKVSSFRAAKLHTRCGMGPCQGRICGPATEFLFGWQRDSVRPPIFPARIRSLVIDEAIPEEAAVPRT